MKTEVKTVSSEALRRAAELTDEITALQAEVNALLAGVESVPQKKRKMTAEGRARISEAQRKRWLKVHQTESPPYNDTSASTPPVE